jgi:hypothetical protein
LSPSAAWVSQLLGINGSIRAVFFSDSIDPAPRRSGYGGASIQFSQKELALMNPTQRRILPENKFGVGPRGEDEV